MKQKDDFLVVFISVMVMLLFLGMGGGGIYYSYKKFSKHIDLVSHGIKTQGHILHYEESWSKDDDGSYTKMYSPVIEYYDSFDQPHVLNVDYSTSSKAWSNDVVVYFDEKNPNRAIQGGFWQLWFWPFFILCLSMIPLGIGLFVLKYYINILFKREDR